MMTRHRLIGTAAAVLALHGAGGALAATLNANSTSDNGGSAGWATFFDLSAASNLAVTHLTTASTATAGGAFSVTVFTRSGSALGGPTGAGVGSSSAGWTSLGSAAATQGASAGGISLAIDIPDIQLMSGQLTGVALLFSVAGPRYLGSGSPPLQTFADGVLTLTTGDSRNLPFTTDGLWFSSRGLTGSLTYAVATVPEPATLLLTWIGLASLALRLRKRA